MHLKFEQRGLKLIENLGCEFTDEGLVKVDEFYKTSIDHVYAVGDMVLKIQK